MFFNYFKAKKIVMFLGIIFVVLLSVEAKPDQEKDSEFSVTFEYESAFPEDVMDYMTQLIKKNCNIKDFRYSTSDETVEQDGEVLFYHAKLSVGKDYDGETFIAVKKTEKDKLEKVELKCPPK